MVILYKDKFIKEVIEDLLDVSKDKKIILRYMDKVTTRKLKMRLNQLKATTCFQKCFETIPHFESLSEDMKHLYSMRLDGNYRLVISPNTDDLSPESLSKCTEYYIEGVVDYHGRGKNNWLIP